LPYTQYSRGAFLQELAQALDDSNRVYWVQDELDRALNEALLHWGALTSYWTASGTFQSLPNQPFHDLSIQLPSLRSRTFTMGSIVREIQYHLLEPASGVAGTGMTDQFTITQITNAVIRRRNQLVLDIGTPLSYTTIPTAPASSVPLDNAMALVSRAAWIDQATGVVTPLRRSDEFAAQAFNPLWNLNPGRPYAFSQAESMPGVMLLIPPAAKAGSVHLTYVATQALAVDEATVLQVPDELALAVKYGALYELLSTNSQGYDPIRSKYAKERYDAIVEIAKTRRSILRVRCDDTPLPLTTIAELDAGKPNWQTGTGLPRIAGCAYDLLALYRVPSTPHDIRCEVAQTAPIGSSFVEVGREEIPYLLDYCRHILQIKVGGVEFVQSMPLYDNFMRGAAQRSKFLATKARYLAPLFGQPTLEAQAHPAA